MRLWKRLAAAVAAAAALFANPAVAPAQTNGNRYPVLATIEQNIIDTLQRAGFGCLPADPQCDVDRNTLVAAAYVNVVNSPGQKANWYALAAALGFPLGSQLGSGFSSWSGSYGGGGTSADLPDPDCLNFTFQTDASGWLVVPALSFPGGKPWKVDADNGYYPTSQGSFRNYAANTGEAVAQWTAHLRNISRDPRDYIGIWYVDRANAKMYFGSVSRFQNGVPTGHVNDNPYSVDASQPWGCCNYGKWMGDKDCPEGPPAEDTDYYPTENGTPDIYPSCTAYTKNYALSPSGYALAKKVAIHPDNFGTYVNGWEKIKGCKLNKRFVAFIADKIAKAATQNPNWHGPAYRPITQEDVGCTNNEVGDMVPPPPATAPAPSGCGSPAPAPGATPTPSPSPSPGGGGGGGTSPDYSDPNIGEPDVTAPDIPTTTWFPAINLNLGSPACPTYSFDAFGTHYVLDSHCPFIEQVRTVISAFMIILFTIAAGRIILDA